MTIHYRDDAVFSGADLADIFRRSGINRPVDDLPRMETMARNANLNWTAWDGELLVGVSRSVTDYAFCCYLSCLAVDLAYQKQGIGKELIALTQRSVGPQVNLLLLSAPTAMTYYPKVGLKPIENGWIIRRTS